MSEFTKEYYEEKAEKMIADMYDPGCSEKREVFKRKLDFYEARIRHFESLECGAVLVEVMKQSILEETLR